ncbi:uncharacterized protein C8A04DRAFT_30775 [Dichotomopilus funicola]|uniref:Uncharacterized protein n=1 Tax=Dichotomopilus funicola TaxID=1934379 RepID=A0AAN6UYN8_9PEZI|nr:hypothetical protein C8A04DRAFT_30775 [Dichotomopilus funicola]
MTSNSRQVALVVGASRGIGRQIAIDLAKAGYTVVVAAKSTTPPSDLANISPFPPDPNSPQSTITTVAREITLAGGHATALPVDTTNPASIQQLVAKTIDLHTRLDILIYNAGAIWWAPVASTPLKRFQLMQRVNVEGLYAVLQAALPYLKGVYEQQQQKGYQKEQQGGPRIVVVCPPIYSRFFRGKTAYAVGKVGMSVLVKGLGMDFVREGVLGDGGVGGMAITGIWPAVAIESGATGRFTRNDPSYARDLRKATIFSDAVLTMIRAPASVVNGQLELDEDFLRSHAGVTDFSGYSVVPGSTPRRIMPAELPDLTVREQDDEGMRTDSSKL